MSVSRTITSHEFLRRGCGYSVTGLADAVGYSHAYISQVENGRTEPSRKYRVAVAKVLQVPEKLLFPKE